MLKHVRIIIILVIGLSFTWQCAEEDETIVEVGSLSIKKSEILSVFKKKYPKQNDFSDVDLSIKKDLIEPLIAKKLRINAAYDLDLDKEKLFRLKYEQYQMRLVGNLYFEKVIVDKVVTQKMIEDYISRTATEIKASHILIGYEKSPRVVNRTLEEAEKIAIDVKKQLKEGKDFIGLAEKYSDDPSAKKNKGGLGYFSWGRMVGPFQEAAWDMKIGEISDPVRTRFGYHIILLEDRRPVANYVEDRSKEGLGRVKQTIMRSFGDSVRVLWEQHYEQLSKDNNYQIFEDQINMFTDTLKIIIKDRPIGDDIYTPEFRQITFAEWDGESISVQTFIDKFDTKLAQMLGNFRDAKVLNKEIKRLSMDGQVLEAADNLGILDDDQIVEALKKFTENHIEKEVEKNSVHASIKLTEDEIAEYYELNKSKFEKPEEIEIWVIDLKDEKKANNIVDKAKQGQNFENLARKYSQDKRLRSKGGYLGYKVKTSRGSVSMEAFKIGPGGKIGGPVRYGRFWSVIKTGEKHEKVLQPFDKVKKRAQSMARSENIKESKIVWENELKEKYEVIIDEEKLKSI